MSDLPRLTLLEELDARQDELLAELDRLNLRLEQVIRECLSDRDPAVSEPLSEGSLIGPWQAGARPVRMTWTCDTSRQLPSRLPHVRPQ